MRILGDSRRCGIAGKFEIYKDNKGRVPVPVEVAQLRDLAQGESYPTKSHAKRGIEAVQRAAAGATVEDLTES